MDFNANSFISIPQDNRKQASDLLSNIYNDSSPTSRYTPSIEISNEHKIIDSNTENDSDAI